MAYVVYINGSKLFLTEFLSFVKYLKTDLKRAIFHCLKEYLKKHDILMENITLLLILYY